MKLSIQLLSVILPASQAAIMGAMYGACMNRTLHDESKSILQMFQHQVCFVLLLTQFVFLLTRVTITQILHRVHCKGTTVTSAQEIV